MYNKNFRREPTEKQLIGKIGEDEACEYLINKGYKIIDRNYYKKWGEIDIIAKKVNFLVFLEVKTVTRVDNVTYDLPAGRQEQDSYNPEDNVHPWKLQRLSRIIQTYILDKNVSDETDWQLDLITVYLDKNKRLKKIEHLEDIVL